MSIDDFPKANLKDPDMEKMFIDLHTEEMNTRGNIRSSEHGIIAGKKYDNYEKRY